MLSKYIAHFIKCFIRVFIKYVCNRNNMPFRDIALVNNENNCTYNKYEYVKNISY